MPSSVLIPSMLGSPIQIAYPPSYRQNEPIISWLSTRHTCAVETVSQANIVATPVTYPAANRALGFPFQIGSVFNVRKVFWFNGATVGTDNADVAVYTEDGATRLVAAGSTAIAGASALQEVDVTDTLLVPGRYWCVYNQNGVTATSTGSTAPALTQRYAGWAQMAGAVPLGSTFTPAVIAGAAFPLFGIANRTQVA